MPTSRSKGHRWEYVQDVFSLIIDGEDGQSVAVPAEALPTLAGEGRRRMIAQQIKPRYLGGEIEAGVWAPALLLHVQTWNAGTTDSGTVALILDRGLDTEIQYDMSPEHARGVAGLLLEEADKASGRKPQAN
jgi:hypothetical protein